MLKFNMPKLRIYQQILICFGLIVTIPTLGVTFINNGINQQALRKELGRFSEHTAEALYRDFGTEMAWQKQHSQIMSRLMARSLHGGKNFQQTASQIADLDGDVDAIGIYDDQGRLLDSYYRNFGQLSPELRLPDDLPRQPPKALPDNTNPADNTHTDSDWLANTILAPNPAPSPPNAWFKRFQPFSVLYFSVGNPKDSPYYLRAVLPLL